MNRYEAKRFIEDNIWFEFGVHKNGMIDIANSHNSTLFTVLNKDQAVKLTKIHNDIVYKLRDILIND